LAGGALVSVANNAAAHSRIRKKCFTVRLVRIRPE
jgi:hypothetical protein